MNRLSWLLYLSSAVPNVAAVFGFVGIAATIGAGWFAITGWIDRDMHETSGDSRLRVAFRKLLPLAVVSFLVASAIPSRETILMVAASEMGETVVTTPEAQEILLDLKAALKKQLQSLK